MLVKCIADLDTHFGPQKEETYAVISIEHGWFRLLTDIGDYLFPPSLFEVLEDSGPLFDVFRYVSDRDMNWKTRFSAPGVCILFTEDLSKETAYEMALGAVHAGCREFHLVGPGALLYETVVDQVAVHQPELDTPAIMTISWEEAETARDVLSVFGSFSNSHHVYFLHAESACGFCYDWVHDFLQALIQS